MSISDAIRAAASATSEPAQHAKRRPAMVIYHHNCADGFAAAWCFHHHHKRQVAYRPYPEFVPGKYGTPPPDVTDRDVYLVDFSYRRPVVEDMLAQAHSVTLVDHHKSALDELAPVFLLVELVLHLISLLAYCPAVAGPGLTGRRLALWCPGIRFPRR